MLLEKPISMNLLWIMNDSVKMGLLHEIYAGMRKYPLLRDSFFMAENDHINISLYIKIIYSYMHICVHISKA